MASHDDLLFHVEYDIKFLENLYGPTVIEYGTYKLFLKQDNSIKYWVFCQFLWSDEQSEKYEVLWHGMSIRHWDDPNQAEHCYFSPYIHYLDLIILCKAATDIKQFLHK